MAIRKPIPSPAPTQEIESRLLNRLARTPGGCWVWQGARDPRGYGKISIGNKLFRTHRLSYVLYCGPIPDGLFVCHNCPGGDNPSCCNPTHLFLGTQADNMKDAYVKGTCRPQPQIGECNPNARLSQGDVLFIRATAEAAKRFNVGGWRKMLSRRFGVSETGIGRIVAGELWLHVE